MLQIYNISHWTVARAFLGGNLLGREVSSTHTLLKKAIAFATLRYMHELRIHSTMCNSWLTAT